MLYVLGKPCRIGTLALLAGSCLAVPCSAQAPQQTPRTAAQNGAKTLRQKARFTAAKTSLPSALAALRKQYGLNFAVDGSPLALQKDVDTAGTLGDVLDSVAEAFDYNWTAAPSGIILMNKRFHNQKETPQASLPEIQQVCRDVLSALAAFDPHSDPSELGSLLFDVASHLSVEQLRALRDGKRIPVTDLPAAQYDLARSAMLNACFAQTCRIWQSLLPLLAALPNAYLDATYYEGKDNYNLFIGLNGKCFASPFSLSPFKIFAPSYPE